MQTFHDYEYIYPSEKSKKLESLLSIEEQAAYGALLSEQAGCLSRSQIGELKEVYKTHINAVSLYMLGCRSINANDLPDKASWNLVELSDSDTGFLRLEDSGVLHTTVKNNRIIMLPNHISEDNWQKFYKEMFAYYKYTASGTNWIIDFSIVSDIPENFWVNIITYNYKLKSLGGELYLCWVHNSILPQGNLDEVCAFFRLKRIGDFYFSTVNYQN
jgi:hypothetical protein